LEPQTEKPFTVNGMSHVVARALKRARIVSDELRHTALSRRIASGYALGLYLAFNSGAR